MVKNSEVRKGIIMLRKDGNYTIYQVERKLLGEKYKDWGWKVDHGIPEGSRGASEPTECIPFGVSWNKKSELVGKNSKIWNKFSASGECWQETGIFGVFNEDDANTLMMALMKNNSHAIFRVTKLTIEQKHEVILSQGGTK